MAIVKMHKFNLYTFTSEQEKVLKSFQKFKHIHLSKFEAEESNISDVEIPKVVLKLDEEISKAEWTLELLNSYLPNESTIDGFKGHKRKLSLEELKNKSQNFDFNLLYTTLNNYVLQKNDISQKIITLEESTNELEPFSELAISGEKLKNISKVNVIPGSISIRNESVLNSKLKESGLELYSIENFGVRNGLRYLIAVVDPSETEEFSKILLASGFTNLKINTDLNVKEAIEEKKKKIAEYKRNLDELDGVIEKETTQIENLKYYYEYLRNERLREASAGKFKKSKTIDMISGYVPSERVEDFKKLVSNILGNTYYLEIEPANKNDSKVPIKLKNNKLIEPFETITEMYAIPRYQELDPTPLLAPFYFVFSGIMIGDMGYGLLVSLICYIMLKVLKPDKTKGRLIKFIMYMGISSIFWGFIFGSFFGDLIKIKAYLNPSEDYMEMIAMCMLFGVIHIFFAMAIKAYIEIRDHKPLDALFDVGFWYMALIGLMVLIATSVLKLNPTVGIISKVVMLIGMVGILFTGGRDQKSVGGKIGWGIYSLYGISSYLGDFVSYFRLMALALSGSFIAIAVNIIVKMLMSGGIIGIIFGILIFIAFQIFNMFLSFLSSYVHSARLTFVEMFNKFYEGGGMPFKEMVTESDYFIIEED